MPHSKDDPKDPEWRPYIFAREQWHCRICGDRFLYSETVRKHIADAHDENMPPSCAAFAFKVMRCVGSTVPA